MTTAADTGKVEKVVNHELDAHRKECMEMLDLKFVRKNPALSVSVGIAIIGIVSGVLAYYYKGESGQDQRAFSVETRLEQVRDDVDKVATRQEKILQVMLERQDSILLNIKALKARR